MAIIYVLLMIVLIAIDQLLKFIVAHNMTLSQTIPVIKIGDKHILNLTFVHNDGAGWSILRGKTVFLVIFTSVMIIAILYYMIKHTKKNAMLMTSLSLIISGGVGNLIDRVFNKGKVVDYIDVKFLDFPVFNFADICVTVGVFILIIYLIVDEVKIRKEKSHESRSVDE